MTGEEEVAAWGSREEKEGIKMEMEDFRLL